MAQNHTFRGEVFPPPSGISLTLPVPVFCFGFYLVFCRPLVFASFDELGPLLSPCLSFSCHTSLTNCVPLSLFLFCFIFLFLLFPGISIDVGATNGVFSCIQMGFYFVTTGWIYEMGLCENSINQSSTTRRLNTPHYLHQSSDSRQRAELGPSGTRTRMHRLEHSPPEALLVMRLLSGFYRPRVPPTD